MVKLLEEFYWGNLQPDSMPVKDPRRMRVEAEKYLELHDKFRSLIGEAAAEAYEEMNTYQNQTEADSEARRFANGFKLGALFMVEVFTD